MYMCSFLVWKKTRAWIIASLNLKVTLSGYPMHGIHRPSPWLQYLNLFEGSRTLSWWMSGKRNVSFCRGYEELIIVYCYFQQCTKLFQLWINMHTSAYLKHLISHGQPIRHQYNRRLIQSAEHFFSFQDLLVVSRTSRLRQPSVWLHR